MKILAIAITAAIIIASAGCGTPTPAPPLARKSFPNSVGPFPADVKPVDKLDKVAPKTDSKTDVYTPPTTLSKP